MDPSVETVLSVAGNAALTLIVVQVLLGFFKVTGAERDRIGPLAALVTGVVFALGAETVIALTDGGGFTAEGIFNAFLVGIFGGWSSMGIHDTADAAGVPV